VLRLTYLLADCIISMSSLRPVGIITIPTGLKDDMEIYTVFQKKWRQNTNHYNYGTSYQN